MDKIKYEKEDLLWEATRRNEFYKALYGGLAMPKTEPIPTQIPKQQTDFIAKLEIDEIEKQKVRDYKNRLKLSAMRKDRFKRMVEDATKQPLSYKVSSGSPDKKVRKSMAREYFGLNFLADPKVDIDTIKKEIASGADPKKVHPYYGFFDKKEATTHHLIPEFVYRHWYWQRHHGQEQSETFGREKEQFEIWFDLFLNQLHQRILISINPNASDDSIFEGIKSIKRKIVAKDKADSQEEKKESREYIPRNIGNYIGWLRKYDAILETLAKTKDTELRREGAIVAVPDKYDFKDMWPNRNEEKENEFETIRRQYRDAYKNAVELIKISPFIAFSTSRKQK